MKIKMYTEDYISEVKKRAEEIITREVQKVTDKYKVRVIFIDQKEINSANKENNSISKYR